MPNSKRKGGRIEREAVQLLRDCNFPAARRTPLSGACGQLFPDLKSDVKAGFTLAGKEVTVECKARAKGFKSLYDWLADAQMLYLRADNKQPLVVMPWDVLAKLLAYVPAEHRLPKPDDPLEALRQAAEVNPYAKRTLEKIQ